MHYLKICAGIAALAFAWVVIYRTRFIFYLNSWMREKVFNDNLVLFSGKYFAALLIIVGGVALFSGLDDAVYVQYLKPAMVAHIVEQAKLDLAKGNHARVINQCWAVVRSQPTNKEAWALLVTASWARGDRKSTAEAANALYRLDRDNPVLKGPIRDLIHESKKDDDE